MVWVFCMAYGIGASRGDMENSPEVERITNVYNQYQTSKWDEAQPGNSAILQERQKRLQQMLQQQGNWPLADKQILDVGCGSGQVLACLVEWGAMPSKLVGVDLLADRIALARQQHPDIAFHCVNAERLGFVSGRFHLILTFTVFSSILDLTMRHNIATELNRVLRPGGSLIWYDFRLNNPRNPHVRGLKKQQIEELFPRLTPTLQSITLLPMLARRLGRFTPNLDPLLAHIPWLRTHYLGLLQKPKEC
jgi:ubiquinone/menaquinone biosynthesis C-methylase UbiE